MKKIKTMGDCPKCNDQLELWKTKSQKRFLKCADPECEVSYSIPAYGTIEYVGLCCPKNKCPILLVTKKNQSIQYFWVDGPCFVCRKESSCEPLVELREEFEMEVVS